MILLGAAYVAVGVFASTLTRFQVVAGLIGIAVLGFFTLGVFLLGLLMSALFPPEAVRAVARLNMITYLSDFSKYPVSLGLRMYQSLEGSWANLLMAASLVTLLPLAVLFFAAQRYFVKGLLLTGSKG